MQRQIPKNLFAIILRNIIYSIIITFILMWVMNKLQGGADWEISDSSLFDSPSKSVSNIACLAGMCITGTLMGLESFFPLLGVIGYLIFLVSYALLGYIWFHFLMKEPYSITYSWVFIVTPIIGIPKMMLSYSWSRTAESTVELKDYLVYFYTKIKKKGNFLMTAKQMFSDANQEEPNSIKITSEILQLGSYLYQIRNITGLVSIKSRIRGGGSYKYFWIVILTVGVIALVAGQDLLIKLIGVFSVAAGLTGLMKSLIQKEAYGVILHFNSGDRRLVVFPNKELLVIFIDNIVKAMNGLTDKNNVYVYENNNWIENKGIINAGIARDIVNNLTL